MAYCPEFNPIENVNSMIRNNVRYNKNKTINDIENVLQEFKNKNHKKEFQNIYNIGYPNWNVISFLIFI